MQEMSLLFWRGGGLWLASAYIFFEIFAEELQSWWSWWSQSTWKQLNQYHRHGQGYEKINRDALKAPIPGFIKPDVNFIAFRFSGKAPMVGFRDKSTFYILWFDARFDLYDH